MSMEPIDFSPIAEAITEYLGERCDDFNPDCRTCMAWKAYDRIAALSSAPEAQQEPVAWQLRYGYGPWACEITQSREVVDRWVRDGHGFRPLYAHPALSPAPEAQQVPVITAMFEVITETGITGSTSVPVKRVEAQDDGSYTVIIDYWPSKQSSEPHQEQVTDAMELARAVLARVMTAGYPNAPGADPEDVEKAFWALDDALKAAMT